MRSWATQRRFSSLITSRLVTEHHQHMVPRRGTPLSDESLKMVGQISSSKVHQPLLRYSARMCPWWKVTVNQCMRASKLSLNGLACRSTMTTHVRRSITCLASLNAAHNVNARKAHDDKRSLCITDPWACRNIMKVLTDWFLRRPRTQSCERRCILVASNEHQCCPSIEVASTWPMIVYRYTMWIGSIVVVPQRRVPVVEVRMGHLYVSDIRRNGLSRIRLCMVIGLESSLSQAPKAANKSTQ